jgi:hypothetical protein
MAPIAAGMDGKRHIVTAGELINRPPARANQRDFAHAKRHGLHEAVIGGEAFDLARDSSMALGSRMAARRR